MRWIVPILALSLTLAACGGSDEPEPPPPDDEVECKEDGDCGSHEWCPENDCVATDCESSSDCPYNYTCHATGFCMPDDS